ncbi:MAG: DNA mismatch repair endonuclease MutL [Pseudomonadota bacterium]
MTVIRLPESVVNQIAAGEVIERPASIVKELIENAIDAGAGRIDIVTANGGKTLIRVIDDGSGMIRDDLELATQRHCTSKLAEDLLDIRTLGFRGEALPSIGAVAKIQIISRHQSSADEAWRIAINHGKPEAPSPAALSGGTSVEVTDLFTTTPARLKFLKSDQAETNAITEIVKRIAIAFPKIRFTYSGGGRLSLDYGVTDRAGRIAQVLGREFTQNALVIDAEREGVRFSGLAGLPTYNRGNGQHQFFYVNGRPVRDKTLTGALRAAYSDFLARDRHPVSVLFLDLEPRHVDVNVHPAKADVRFRDPGLVRGLIVGALRQAIAETGARSSGERSFSLAEAFKTGQQMHHASPSFSGAGSSWQTSPNAPPGYASHLDTAGGFSETQAAFDHSQPSGKTGPLEEISEDGVAYPLGAARAQLHKNYIVAQTENGLVIVDQHAAHERIVYEALKKAMEKGIARQILLVPEIVDLPAEDVSRLSDRAEELSKYGLVIEAFGPGAIAVREAPSMLGELDIANLIRDLADEIAEWDSTEGLKERLEHVAATMACHGSVRSGRILKHEEMNALLRSIETTPNSGQCNHGRPTFIELSLKDIERLFGR